MADLVVTISGQSAAYRAGTLSLSGSLGTRTTASLQTVDHPPFADVVEVGQVVEIRDETGSLIFAGTVDSVEEEIDASKRLRVKRLACVDYTQIADRHLVAYVYQPDEEHPTIAFCGTYYDYSQWSAPGDDYPTAPTGSCPVQFDISKWYT